jgi:hypothetical protein
LDSSIKKARRDLTESVWRTYKYVMLLGKDNTIKSIDLGLVTSSAAESMTKLILSRLRQSGEVEKEVSPRFLVRNWPPAFTAWSTKAVRDAFYASPHFPRLLSFETIKDTIARGVSEGSIAYAGKSPKGDYDPFFYKTVLDAQTVELSEDMVILTADEAEKHIEPPRLARVLVTPSQVHCKPGMKQTFTVEGLDQFGRAIELGEVQWSATGGTIGLDGVFTASEDEGNFLVTARAQGNVGTAGVTVVRKVESGPGLEPTPPQTVRKLTWTGEVAPQKWTNLYMKVLTKLVSSGELKLCVSLEAIPKGGVSDQQVEETRAALRGLGLDDNVRTE